MSATAAMMSTRELTPQERFQELVRKNMERCFWRGDDEQAAEWQAAYDLAIECVRAARDQEQKLAAEKARKAG